MNKLSMMVVMCRCDACLRARNLLQIDRKELMKWEATNYWRRASEMPICILRDACDSIRSELLLNN